MEEGLYSYRVNVYSQDVTHLSVRSCSLQRVTFSIPKVSGWKALSPNDYKEFRSRERSENLSRPERNEVTSILIGLLVGFTGAT